MNALVIQWSSLPNSEGTAAITEEPKQSALKLHRTSSPQCVKLTLMPNACLPRHVRQVSCWRAGLRRLISTHTQPETRVEQSTTISEDGFRTLRKRQHGGRDLPLPPLLDDIAIEARRKHTKPKAWKLDKGAKTEFQKQLEQNPYGPTTPPEPNNQRHQLTPLPAQALATPIRQCVITSARLPSYFLLPFVSTLDPPSTPKGRLEPDKPYPNSTPDPLRSPSRSYILSNQRFLRTVTEKKWWIRLVSLQIRTWFSLRTGRAEKNLKPRSDWIWDGEVGGKALGVLREEVVRHLGVLVRRKRVVVLQGAEDWARAREKGVRFVLAVGAVEGESMSAFEQQVGERSHVPVYDMATLVGEEKVKQLLVEDLQMSAEGQWLAVLPSTQSTDLAVAILKLQDYVSEKNVQ